jgi:large subunit ribosomal protein L31
MATMKAGIHPEYRPVVFQDTSANFAFLTRSTIHTEKTIKWEDGNEYPLVTLEISSASHPFYTGTQKLIDTAGRVERFEKRFAKTSGKTVERKPKKTQAAPKMSAAVKKVLRNTPTVAAPVKGRGAPRVGKKADAKGAKPEAKAAK